MVGGKAQRAHLEFEPVVRVHSDLVVFAQRRQQRTAVGQIQAQRLADRSRLRVCISGFRVYHISTPTCSYGKMEARYEAADAPE